MKISEVDKAVRSLDTTDGTRARYIFNKMKKAPNPDAVLKEYMRKGLINGPTYNQIQLLKKQ